METENMEAMTGTVVPYKVFTKNVGREVHTIIVDMEILENGELYPLMRYNPKLSEPCLPEDALAMTAWSHPNYESFAKKVEGFMREMKFNECIDDKIDASGELPY